MPLLSLALPQSVVKSFIQRGCDNSKTAERASSTSEGFNTSLSVKSTGIFFVEQLSAIPVERDITLAELKESGDIFEIFELSVVEDDSGDCAREKLSRCGKLEELGTCLIDATEEDAKKEDMERERRKRRRFRILEMFSLKKLKEAKKQA